MDEYEKLQKLYKDGYKCIRYDIKEDGELDVYFKNFEQEKSTSIVSKNFDEKMNIITFIRENTMF